VKPVSCEERSTIQNGWSHGDRDQSDYLEPLDSPTLFPYKITDEGQLVHVDFEFFQDLKLASYDYLRIEATADGIEITPIKGDPTVLASKPYRKKRR
jgi:hypothetical protein